MKPVEREQMVTLKFPEPEALFPPVLQLDSVTFAYDNSAVVLENVDLSANMQSRICIVGDNGAGKTTLLKLVNGERFVHSFSAATGRSRFRLTGLYSSSAFRERNSLKYSPAFI